MTCGVFRPVVIVPANWCEWSDEQRQCVLLHELAHVKRYDVALQIMARLTAAIYWFNPLVWYALGRLRVERELACDDCVLMAGERPSVYAQALLRTVRAYRRQRTATAVAMAASARLDDRVNAISGWQAGARTNQSSPVPVAGRLFCLAGDVCRCFDACRAAKGRGGRASGRSRDGAGQFSRIGAVNDR